MQIEGFVPIDVDPRENASGGKAIECPKASGCSAKFRFERAAGRYEMDVRYFDQNNGASRFRVLKNDHSVDEWIADDHLPATNPAATRPPGVEFPRSYSILEMRFALKDIRTHKNMPRWTTLSCVLHPNPDEPTHPILARRS